MRAVLFMLVGSVALHGSEAAAQSSAQTHTAERFEETFGLSEPEYDSRLRRLRSVGWSSLWGLMTTGVVLIALDDTLFPNDSSDGLVRTALVYPLLMGGGLIIGGALLLRARAMVIRRRRFRERQPALDRSYFHPELDIGITPGGLSLHLSF